MAARAPRCLVFITAIVLARAMRLQKGTTAKHVLKLDAEAPRGSDEAQKFALAMQWGLEAVRQAALPFKTAPPDVRRGVNGMSAELWKVALLGIPEKDRRSRKAKTARTKWLAAFKEDNAEVYDGIHRFQGNGETDAFMAAIAVICKLPRHALINDFPKAAVYLDAVVDIVQGLAESWDDVFMNRPQRAAKAIWIGVHKAADSVLPTSERVQVVYQMVMSNIDPITSELTRSVVSHRRMVMQTKVCYKNTIRRGKTRPSVCREGFAWTGGYLCVPHTSNGADCWMPCGKKGGWCPGFCGEDKVCCRRGSTSDPRECKAATGFVDHRGAIGGSREYHQCVVPHHLSLRSLSRNNSLIQNGWPSKRQQPQGYVPAMCDASSKYDTKYGDWCSSKCPEHFFEHGDDGLKCYQECFGRFPADGWGACGTSQAELPSLMVQIGKAVLFGGVKVGSLIFNMTQNGFNVDNLIDTVEALVEMGKPFDRPMCPVPPGYIPEKTVSSPVVFEVQNVGDRRMRGEWIGNTYHRDRPTYQKINDNRAILEWSQTRMLWRMFYDDTLSHHGRVTLYENSQNSLNPPIEGWQVVFGADPPPTFVEVYDASRDAKAEQPAPTPDPFEQLSVDSD